jgi:uncharacterized membrane protein YkoI
MYASQNLSLKLLLSLWAMALVLAAPCAFAKKDLFANEPAGSHTSQAQSLVTTSADAKTETPTVRAVEPKIAEIKTAPEEKKPSYLETQLIRFKGHLVETKEDLFGSKTSSKKIKPDAKALVENTAASDENSKEETQPELPVISPTEAAQRAQTYSDGQVINVRQYQDEGNQRYAVKLLQKNGRMKTINLNAFNGELIEESTAQ